MKIMIVTFSLTIVRKIVLCTLTLFNRKFISLDSISVNRRVCRVNRFTSSKGRLHLVMEIKFSFILNFSFAYFENISFS